MENQSTYRIRTKVGEDKPINIPVNLTQEYNSFEILSLKVNMDDTYRSYTSTEGIVVGRVSTANNGLGVPNVRVSIFVPKGSYEQSDEEAVMYPFSSPTDLDGDRVRYNLLPSDSDVACYQIIGTLPTKRKILDNETVLEVFDKFYKYTTVTNEAGDFMLSNIPVGKQRLHIDADLSDIGPFLSQKPYDMIENLGFDKNKFESSRQFKSSTDLDSLVQVISQNKSVYVYPYWGDVTEKSAEMKITRTDLSLNYEFNTSAIFIGSVITDKQSNSIRQNCTAPESAGKMADMVTGPGRIEMIRKTVDGKIEQHRVKGDMLINDNGVWCYQVPMNLDYVRTDEFGNIIPTDDPKKGVPTRARVRFRITLNEMESDNDAHKRCSYLVPNNPKITDEKFLLEDSADYSFGSDTWDESFVDMFWNKVYTVKNYIPQIQKSTRPTNRKHTGIKMTNHFGDNNPFPYNNMSIKLSFQYRLICVIVKVFILLVGFINNLISILGGLPCWLASFPICIIKCVYPFGFAKKFIPSCIELSSEFCDDGINKNVYFPGCGKPLGCVWNKITKPKCSKEQKEISDRGDDAAVCTNSGQELYTCVENELAQTNEATSFNFANDWVNGCLYMPLWYRKIRPKKSFFFGLFKRRAKDQWCAGESGSGSQGAKVASFCAVSYNDKVSSKDYKGENLQVTYRKMNKNGGCGNDCHSTRFSYGLNDGVIMNVENTFGQKVWYYKSVEIALADNDGYAIEYLNAKDKPKVSKTLFATDIVLLGSMNDCDQNGIPKFFNYLKASTYNMPTDILFTDTVLEYSTDKDGNVVDQSSHKISVSSGADWGNKNEYGLYDGGLFYSIGCSKIQVEPTSCINLKRVCEIGIGLDEIQYVDNIDVNISSSTDTLDYNKEQEYNLRPDGFISYDDINDFDYRSMFATMNGNGLLTKINTNTGVREYDFRHLYIDNFDGSLRRIMESGQRDTEKGGRGQHKSVNYFHNYKLEETSKDYLTFRMGDRPYYYDGESLVGRDINSGPNRYRLPKYENSFYFYFGLKEGKTAIDLFNEEYNAPCLTKSELDESIPYEKRATSWCYVDSDKDNTYNHINYDGFLKINFENIPGPYSAILNSKDNNVVTYTFLSEPNADGSQSIDEDRVGFCGDGNVNDLDGYKRIYLLYENPSLKDDDGNLILSHTVTTSDGIETKNGGVLCYMPANGEYTLNIVDGEGNQHSFNINLKSTYLSFDDVEENFAQPNNVLKKYFKDNGKGIYDSVAKTPIEPKGTNFAVKIDDAGVPDVKRISLKEEDGEYKVRANEEIKLNGTICLYNLYYDDEKLNTFTIEVECVDEDEDLKEWYTYNNIKMFFDNDNGYMYNSYTDDGTYITPGALSPYFYFYNRANGKESDKTVPEMRCHIIRCPKGGVNYNVRVTQVCKDDSGKFKKTQNIVERKIYVSEPTPYKLLINDVDYDIIKNFKTGWELSGQGGLQTTNEINGTLPFDGVGDISKIEGWLNISNVNNPKYSWDEEKEKYGSSSKQYTVLNENSVIKTFIYEFDDGINYVRKNEDYIVTNDDVYVGKYYDVVQLELAEKAEPEEPKNYNYDNENKFNQAYSNWDIAHMEWMNDVEQLRQEVQPLLNRLEFIDAMKNAFWIQEEDSEKSITYMVQTDDNPYDVWTLYNSEEVSQTDDDYNETKSKTDGTGKNRACWIYTSESETMISGIKIPNITSYDSKYFGISEDTVRQNNYTTTYGTIIKNGDNCYAISGQPNGIAFAQDNIAENSMDSGSITIKPPYIVGCINKEGKTKPENLIQKTFYGITTNKYGLVTPKFGTDSGDNDGYIKDGNGHQFFQFYLIDKIFAPDIVNWSYIRDIPYYIPWLPYDAKPSDYQPGKNDKKKENYEKRNDASKLGVVVKTYGIISGNILNGITNQPNTVEDFETKNIYDKDVPVKTYMTDTEDSIPTRRSVMNKKTRDQFSLCFEGVKVENNFINKIYDKLDSSNGNASIDGLVISNKDVEGAKDNLDEIHQMLDSIISEINAAIEVLEEDINVLKTRNENLENEISLIEDKDSDDVKSKYNEIKANESEILKKEKIINEKTTERDNIDKINKDIVDFSNNSNDSLTVTFNGIIEYKKQIIRDMYEILNRDKGCKGDLLIGYNSNYNLNEVIDLLKNTIYERDEENEDGLNDISILMENINEINKKKKNYVLYRHAIESYVTDSNQYRLVPSREGELEFVDKDSSASTGRSLYGSMCVTLRSTTLNACHKSFYEDGDTSLTLKVNVTNGDSDKPITYYIFQVNRNGLYDKNARTVYYPVNAFNYTIEEKNNKNVFYIDCNDKTIPWCWDDNKVNAPQFFNKNTLERHFRDKNDGDKSNYLAQVSVKSQIQRENSDGETVYDDKTGYGNTGIFTNLSHEPYFIAAVTENNCRAVSPVYDFTMVYYGIALVDAGGGQKALRVWLEKVINEDKDSENYKKPNNYYLTQFDFTINYTVGNGDNTIASGDVPYYYSFFDIKKTYDSKDKFNDDKEFFEKLEIGESVSVKISDGDDSNPPTYEIHTKTGGTINAETIDVTAEQYKETDLPKTYWYESTIINETTGAEEKRWVTITIKSDGSVENDVKEKGKEPEEGDERYPIGEKLELFYKKDVSVDTTDAEGNPTTETITKYYKITLSETNETVQEVNYDPSIPYFKRYYDKVLTEKETKMMETLLNQAKGNSIISNMVREMVNKMIKFYVVDVTGLKHRAYLNTVK